MGKHKGKTKGGAKGSPPRTGWGFLVSSAVVVAMVVGLATWYFLPERSHLSDAAQYKGGPRLVVDKDLVDFGSVRFEKWVEAKFRLRNVGDQPLQLAVDRQVEAIEGC